jgi:MFS family permease
MNPTEQELAAEVAHSLRLARVNYFVLGAIYVIALAASVLATLLAATGFSGGWQLTVLTAVPGAVLLLNNAFRFNARAEWHYEKKRRLASLLRLSRAGAKATSPAEVAEKWNRIDEEMNKLRPAWGPLPILPHKGENTRQT